MPVFKERPSSSQMKCDSARGGGLPYFTDVVGFFSLHFIKYLKNCSGNIFFSVYSEYFIF